MRIIKMLNEVGKKPSNHTGRESSCFLLAMKKRLFLVVTLLKVRNKRHTFILMLTAKEASTYIDKENNATVPL